VAAVISRSTWTPRKWGWWPGGFITVEVEGNFGNSVNPQTGGYYASEYQPDSSPPSGSDQLNIPNVSIMQFFSHYIGVVVGKVATITAHPPAGYERIRPWQRGHPVF